jgi:hypothetical protein
MSPKRDFKENSLRSEFKAYLSKLLSLDTREQALKDIKGMIVQNKTTSNLRVWLSVLSENRTKNAEYEVLVIGFMVSQYKKGLLDPLDKAPSLDKTIFRICELLSRFFKVVALLKVGSKPASADGLPEGLDRTVQELP